MSPGRVIVSWLDASTVGHKTCPDLYTFSGNSVFYDGGAVNSQDASPQFSNCTFSSNFALDGVGGALQVKGTGLLLATDCTFSNNESVYGGGGVEVFSANPKFTRCTFSANTTSSGAGGGVEKTRQTRNPDPPLKAFSP